jgi:hypothetical protein
VNRADSGTPDDTAVMRIIWDLQHDVGSEPFQMLSLVEVRTSAHIDLTGFQARTIQPELLTASSNKQDMQLASIKELTMASDPWDSSDVGKRMSRTWSVLIFSPISRYMLLSSLEW